MGQIATDEKSNEIPAIPKLLKLLELNGALASIDAMGCQTEIAENILERGGDYVLVVKGNQPTLLEAVQEAMGEVFDEQVNESEISQRTTRDNGHGRQELRIYTTRSAPEALRAQWPGLKVIGTCYHERTVDGKTSTEMRYFIGSKRAGANYYGEALRHHWRIENCCYWQMDGTFGEDASRITKRRSAGNFALMWRMALNLIKPHPSKLSMKCKRMAASLNTDFLEEILREAIKPEKI